MRGLNPGRYAVARVGLRVAALVGLVVLSGCGWMPFSSSSNAPAQACPTTAILRPLASTAMFSKAGTGMRPTDVAFYGILSEVDAKCETSGDTLRAKLDVIIAAERAAAGRGESVDLTYFVAVVGLDQTILSKKSFAVRVPLPDTAKRGGVTDHIEELIALGGRPAADLSIVLGFQHSPQAIDFYEHFRGR